MIVEHDLADPLSSFESRLLALRALREWVLASV
jgi:hypothetical protein